MIATSVVPPPMSTIRFPPGLGDGEPSADRCGDGFFDQVHLARARVECRVANGPPLDPCDPGRYANDNPGPEVLGVDDVPWR